MGSILLVDDDAGVLRTLARLVRARLSAVVVTAGSHAEALEHLGQRADWGCLVLDVSLGPDQPTGLDLLEQARIRFPGVPAIILTGQLDECVRVRALALGAEYLTKPADPDELLAAIARGLAGGRY